MVIPFRSFVGELFFGVVALQMPIQKNHYTCMHERSPFPGTVTYVYTRKWYPLQGELALLTKYVVFSNKPILIHSMLAAGIVQDTFAGKAVQGEGGEEKTTGGYFYSYFYRYFYRSG